MIPPVPVADTASLRETYRLGLAAKLAAIAEAIAAARISASGSLDDAEALAHRLHGSAGAFGFGAVGEAAGRLERALCVASRAAMSERPWCAIELAVAELHRAVASARETVACAAPSGPVAPDRVSTVLIVDDEADIRTIGRISLEDVGGMRVLLARSGEEGLAIAASERPDVILLDVMMPKMDGLSTLARLREDPRTACIPVLFVTAKAQPHEVEHYLRAGARGVIAKPFEPLSLPEELRRALSAPQPADGGHHGHGA